MSTAKQYDNLFISRHPLILDKLSRLRNQDTPYYHFKSLLEEVSQLLFYEACVTLQTVDEKLTTPLEEMTGQRVKREILLVPILRAGLSMVNGIMKVWQEARVGMLGMYRDHDTLEPVDYYVNLPENLPELEVFLLDPMLATGGSATAGMERLKEKGVKSLKMIALLCAPEGVEVVENAHPDVKVYSGALDRQLNEKGYILPGLGDAGDRYFGV